MTQYAYSVSANNPGGNYMFKGSSRNITKKNDAKDGKFSKTFNS